MPIYTIEKIEPCYVDEIAKSLHLNKTKVHAVIEQYLTLLALESKAREVLT